MFDRPTLESMRRVDLQALAKDHGIKANLKNDKIILQLLGKTDEETDDETTSLPRQAPPVSTTTTRSRIVSGSKSRGVLPSGTTSKQSVNNTDETSTKRGRATKSSARPAKKKQLAPTPTPGDSEPESDQPPEAPEPATNTKSKKESQASSVRTHRVSRPSLDTPYIELPSRRLSGNTSHLPVGGSSPSAPIQETVTSAMAPRSTQPSMSHATSRLTAATSDQHSLSPPMSSSPRIATFDLNNVVAQLQASAEYKSLLQSVETSQTMVKTLQTDIDSERARSDDLQKQLDLAKASMERESQEQQTNMDATLTKLDALDSRLKSAVDASEVTSLKIEIEAFREQLATTKRETDGLIESHKATVSALETYARGLEIRLKKLEDQKASAAFATTSMGPPPPPLHLGKRDRVDLPNNAEVTDSPSGAPSPSKKTRYSVMSESSEEASQVDLSLMDELLEEPPLPDVDTRASSSNNPKPPGPQQLHNRPPFSSLVPPTYDPPSTSSMTTFSSLVPPPNYRRASSSPKPSSSSLAPPTSSLYEPPIAELPFPLSPRKGSTDHVPLPLVAEPSVSTSPIKSGPWTNPFSFSSTTSGVIRKNNTSGRHNPIGRRNGSQGGNPSTPTKLVRTSAISFGQSLRAETLGTPLSTSTPARNDNGIGINVTSPSVTDISFGGIQIPSPRPSSSVFRQPSFTFGDSLGLGVPSSSTDTNVKDNRADPPSPAFPVDAGPRARDPFGFDEADANNGSGVMLDSPPPPSPAKRTMYGTEITASSTSNGLGKNDAMPIPSLTSRLSPAGLSTVQEETESGFDLSGGRSGGQSGKGSGSGADPRSNASPSKYGLDTPESWGSPRR